MNFQAGIFLIVMLALAPTTGVSKELVFSSIGQNGSIDFDRDTDLLRRNELALKELQPGDVTSFEYLSDGKTKEGTLRQRVSFRVGRLLGEGNTTRIYELPDHPDLVLRIPSGWKRRVGLHQTPIPEFINLMKKGEAALVDGGVLVTRISGYQESLFLVVEKIRGITFEQFVDEPHRLPPEIREKMYADLDRLAQGLAGFDIVADFRANQLMFDLQKRAWVLVDWTYPHSSASRTSPRNPFAGFLDEIRSTRTNAKSNEWMDHLEKKLKIAVNHERKQRELLRQIRQRPLAQSCRELFTVGPN